MREIEALTQAQSITGCATSSESSCAKTPVVILAGGRGARFDHESQVTPKPMIEVAGKPILQHIIDSMVAQGFREFIVPTGFLHEQVDAHFGRQGTLVGPWTYRCVYSSSNGLWYCPYVVRTMNTGVESHTGSRLWQVRELIGERRFVLTYGDGLSDVDMAAVLQQHVETEASVTLTAVRPAGRFGVIEFWNDRGSPTVCELEEKVAVGWINGGFMVMEPSFVAGLLGDGFPLETGALRELSVLGALHAYRHYGYWRCMDTRRDREQIEEDVRVAGRLSWMR